MLSIALDEVLLCHAAVAEVSTPQQYFQSHRPQPHVLVSLQWFSCWAGGAPHQRAGEQALHTPVTFQVQLASPSGAGAGGAGAVAGLGV